MPKSVRFLFLVFIAAALSSCSNNRADEIPISDFFKSPEKVYFRISPNGKYVSYVKKTDGRRNLFIQSLDNGGEFQATSFEDYDIRDYNWTYGNQIILNQDVPEEEEHKLFVLDIATRQIKQLLVEKKAFMRILFRNRNEPDVVTLAMNKRDSVNFDVYRLNVKTGELNTYLENPGKVRDWYADADGKIRLVKASDGVDETILFRENDSKPFKPIITNNYRNTVKPIGFTGVKNYFYAISNVGRDKAAFVEINAENGKEERVIYANDKVDIQRVDYSKYKYRLEFAAWDEAKPQKHFLNSGVEAVYKELAQKLTGSEINIDDKDTAENKFIVSTYTDRDRGSVYLYDRPQNSLTKLNDNSSINPDELCEMQPISYHATDGLLINGYLTLPQGQDKTNLPVVVIPHGGPLGMRNSWGYNGEVQFLASRGYAVLQINYRGSSGYGKAFYAAGFKESGGKIQQDITDGVNWLIANKIANPAKVAIYGSGFGGFSALYGVSFNPYLYNCAIVQNGLINFFTYVKTAPSFLKPTLQRMYETVGDPEKDADRLRAISPVFHPDKPKVPLIIYQDSRDRRANIAELNHYVRELQKRNVPVTYIVNTNDRRTAASERKRMDFYATIEKFLDENMRVKP